MKRNRKYWLFVLLLIFGRQVFRDYIPCGNIICFEPSETIRTLIEWVKMMRENLTSGRQAVSVETRCIASLPPSGMTETLRYGLEILIKKENYV
jgi:hypothetical protein